MSTQIGKRAESRAVRHLRLRGYRILDRNARLGRGELDIVARRQGVLTFVEVKQRPTLDDGLLAVHADKQDRLRSAASAWLARHKEYQNLSCRFDLVIFITGGIVSRIEHLQDVFR